MKSLALLLLVCVFSGLNAQTDTLIKRNKLAFKIGYEIQGDDTLPVYLINKYVITAKVTKTPEEIKAYEDLVSWVRKTLPYAKLAAFRLQMMEDNLNMMSSEKEKKKYIKECEKAIKTQFMDDLKNMYVKEGLILLKLIHRETGETTWDIMKEYGGTFETLLFQTMAKTYNADMKVTYDPVQDYQIEEIIQTIEKENAKKN